MNENAANVRTRRQAVFPWGDRVAFALGLLFTVIMLGVFTNRMLTGVSRDRALKEVPASTPTPPPPPPPTGH